MTKADKEKYTRWALWGGAGVLLYLMLRPKKAAAAGGGSLATTNPPRFGYADGQCVDLIMDLNVSSDWCTRQNEADPDSAFFYPPVSS